MPELLRGCVTDRPTLEEPTEIPCWIPDRALICAKLPIDEVLRAPDTALDCAARNMAIRLGDIPSSPPVVFPDVLGRYTVLPADLVKSAARLVVGN